eukprot:363033-Chlamydomonas_euryale.AAC.1
MGPLPTSANQWHGASVWLHRFGKVIPPCSTLPGCEQAAGHGGATAPSAQSKQSQQPRQGAHRHAKAAAHVEADGRLDSKQPTTFMDLTKFPEWPSMIELNCTMPGACRQCGRAARLWEAMPRCIH